ncbi:rCG55553 [Rattus norvegicus]|uniref:RCG55553 n=1 Tax=Rattus norvegicus TaxID=10116 RepID=A6JRB3_RAT|nr:rCG55553 [Rattus norvegicus]
MHCCRVSFEGSGEETKSRSTF